MEPQSGTSPQTSYPLALFGYLQTEPKWHVAKSEDADPVFNCVAAPCDHFVRFPLEDVGKDYVGLENADQVEEFLLKYGPFRTRGPFGVGVASDQPASQTCAAFLRHVWAWRAYLVSGSLAGNPDEPNPYRRLPKTLVDWFNKQAAKPFNAKLGLDGGLRAAIICEDVEEAIRAFVFLERLAGREWDNCGRCQKLYRKSSAKGRACNDKCLSVLTSRDLRERRRKCSKRRSVAPVATPVQSSGRLTSRVATIGH